MKRALKWFAALVVGLLIVAGGLALHTWYFKPLSISWFYGRVFAQYALEQPELLSRLRVVPPSLDFYSGELNDASLAEEEKLAAIVQKNHDVLLRYDRSSLDREGKLSYDVLEYFLRMQVEGYPFRHHAFPIDQTFGMQSQLPNFMAQVHEVTSQRDAERYVTRLKQFPRKFSQVTEGLKLREAQAIYPPQFTVDEVIAQMQGLISPAPRENMLWVSFKEKLEKAPAIDPPAREKLLASAEAAIRDDVYPAYRQFIDYFTALKPKAQGNFGAWHLPNGEAYYAWCVRQHTTTEMMPDQIHALGLAEVERIGAQMDAILRGRGLTEGSVGERTRHLSEDPAQRYAKTAEDEAAMLVRYQAILDEVNAGLGGAFDVRPEQGVVVKAVPAFAEKNSPYAYYEAGSFDGKRPGVFYANMREPGETPKFGMRTLAYHEGIPGHHFQISIAQELRGVPFFRRILPFTAFHEGWALYAERLAWELGFEKDPLDDLGRLRDEQLRAVRLVVDTGIHAKRWSREQAIAYMMDKTGMAESEVVAEIERYFVAPGQALAYKVGMLKILELRERAKQTLGPRFDLKQFHDQVLTHGALPLVLLERVIDEWIAQQKTG